MEEAMSCELVIEAIIEQFGMMNEEEWWRIICVSKQWKRLSKQILKEIHETKKWPRFVIPETDSWNVKVFKFQEDSHSW